MTTEATSPATDLDPAVERPPAVHLEGVTFAYPDSEPALRGVDLRIERGEYVAVMGANGAGKTTLCLLLNGVIPNVIGGTLEGSIVIDGLVTVDHHVYELAERVGVVLQDPDAQILATNVVAEVAFAAENLGVPRETMIERIGRALSLVRLSGFEGNAPEELSGGQKQRLALAAGLVMNPPIFVLDEPTAQLDPIGNAEVFEVLDALSREGTTVVVATHNSEDVARHATRVVVLDGGRIVADGSPREVFTQVELLDRVGINVPEVVRIQTGLGLADGGSTSLALDAEAAVARILSAVDGGALTVGAPNASVAIDSATGTPIDPGAAPLIEVRGLRYSYGRGERPALDGVDFHVDTGEFVGLIGQNGSGKSTLIKCLAGLLVPDAGEIRLNGVAVSRAEARRLPRRIGVVLQNPDTQLFRMSVREEVAFGLANIGVPEAEREERITYALALTGLTEMAEIYPFKLSFGDRRKVAVAAIVAMQPELLVFDEPTTGQDYVGRYRLCDIAESLNRQGTTVVMITHDMDLVARFARRAVVLGMGQVLADGPVRDVFSQPDMLRETYLRAPQAAQVAQGLGGLIPRTALSVADVLDSFTVVAR